MIPDAHPVATAQVDRAALERTAIWSPAEYAVGDDRLEKWLVDQLLLSLLPMGEKLRVLGEMSGVLLRLRDARQRQTSLRVAVEEALPPGASRDWRIVEAGQTIQVWRCGERAWAVQLSADADGAWRWKAGHSFRPFAACHVPTRTTKKGGYCLSFASVLEPRCLTHAAKSFVEDLRTEQLVAPLAGSSERPEAVESE